MINQDAYRLGSQKSGIRELFEFGNKRAAEVGRENVYDFSIGNPSEPAPKEVNEAIIDIISNIDSVKVHGYTSAQGNASTRKAIADDMNDRFDAGLTEDNFYMTCGAAASLTSVLRALTIDANTEFVTVAPFFPEYSVFATIGGGKLKVVEPDIPDFQILFNKLEDAITKNTQAIIINSPNNPSGVIYSEETLVKLAELLRNKSTEIGHTIYLIADEPYRELVYDGAVVPYVPAIYNNTIICYSYSKSLSLPGERIGYVLVPNCVDDWKRVYDAVAGAARNMGYVCAPALTQLVIERCTKCRPNLEAYAKNRKLLMDGLAEAGYTVADPAGAFYLFVKAPNGDSAAFSEIGKKHDVLLVPGGSFGCPEYFRLCYCVPEDMIKRSIPIFKAMIDECK
ncbi:MAG: pyridoxal phosphate-dependent aminotransferase [Eubacteriaceae bacterium]|nr:pyridoxal phosphate-dependent aminotransferase [Eubacteriaceae bacterium]